MKKLFLILAVVLFPCIVLAQPFLVCDPVATGPLQPTHYDVTIGGATITVPATAGTGGAVTLKYDLGNIPSGNYTVNVKAVRQDPAWGRLVSSGVPFVFVKPGTPLDPAGIKLSQ